MLKEDYYQARGDSCTDEKLAETDEMLKEMLTDYKTGQKKWLLSFLSNESNIEQGREGSILLNMSGTDRESILEVLNDIRVGSWILLGSPGVKGSKSTEVSELGADLRQVAWAMDLSGYFQMGFLRET